MSARAWCVEVEWHDYSTGEETTSLYGPFRNQETADAHAGKLKAALPDPGDCGYITVWARRLDAPLIRPVVAEARRWIEVIAADMRDADAEAHEGEPR